MFNQKRRREEKEEEEEARFLNSLYLQHTSSSSMFVPVLYYQARIMETGVVCGEVVRCDWFTCVVYFVSRESTALQSPVEPNSLQ